MEFVGRNWHPSIIVQNIEAVQLSIYVRNSVIGLDPSCMSLLHSLLPSGALSHWRYPEKRPLFRLQRRLPRWQIWRDTDGPILARNRIICILLTFLP